MRPANSNDVVTSLTWPFAAGALGPVPNEPWTCSGTVCVACGGAGVAVGVPPPPNWGSTITAAATAAMGTAVQGTTARRGAGTRPV